MKPKNSKERNSSFIKFIGLFILVVTVLLVAVFFNFRIPTQENLLLKATVDEVEASEKYQIEFASEVVKVKGMIDSLDIEGGNRAFDNEILVLRLAKIQESINNGEASDANKDLYFDIIESYEDLRKAKEELEDLKDAKKTIEQLKEAYDKSDSDLKELRREYQILRNTCN